MLIFLFLACPPEEEAKGAGDTGPVEIPLAPAFAAVAGATYQDAFKSTCSMQMDLVDAATGNALATTGVISGFDGGLWAALPLGEGQQYKATITWDDCENTPDGSGTFTSSSFSGEPGDLFVSHYDGVDAGFEWMEQGDAHRGGSVHVKLTSESAAASVAAQLGGTTYADENDDTLAYVDWTGDENVAAVLGSLREGGNLAWGEPTWTEKPAWW
ncbi:MAG: hypothetical protein FJ102_15700 [Deltaproteobacteria bacterium]|nr:hypothetical protein [Deltaproteobacteria bacterium]